MDATYSCVPLGRLNPQARSSIIKKLGRAVDALLHTSARFEDHLPGICISGAACLRCRAAYDWSRDGLQIRCKSAQMCWSKSDQRWGLSFHGIRLKEIGELILVLFTPRGLHIYRHRSKFGISSSGLRSVVHGDKIVLRGPAGELGWSIALDAMLHKLDSSPCEFLAVVEW